MTTARQNLGKLGEAVAARSLARAGWEIIDRNYRCPYGEIDIVGRDGRALVFVEVRTRTSDRFGSPAESITPAKKRHMTRCALAYLEAHPQRDDEWRIDLIGVSLDKGRIVRLEHIKHALQ